MHYTTNRTLLEKADLALADLTGGGGVLLPAQAQTFMRLLIKQSALMQQATVVPMPAPKYQISKLRFGSRLLRPGREGVALAPTDRTRADMGFLALDAQLFKAEVHLSDEVLEDNIERGELRQTVLGAGLPACPSPFPRDLVGTLLYGASSAPPQALPSAAEDGRRSS